MGWFFLALAATLFASAGGQDQRLMAHISGALGGRPALLTSAFAACALTSAAAAWAGAAVVERILPQVANMAAIVALIFAAALLLRPSDWRSPGEPTHSLFAIGSVLAALQLLDPARLLIFAMTVAAGGGATAIAVAAGGAIGSAAALATGWALRGELRGFDLPSRVRIAAGCGLIAVAIWCVLAESGIV